jgi:hypothetical protein
MIDLCFYCDCVNDAGDILNPSFSVLGLKGAPFPPFIYNNNNIALLAFSFFET